MSHADFAYDPTDASSIVEYAKRLEGHTLREMSDAPELPDPTVRRGAFGNALEKYYFGYAINSDSAPDFAEAGLELKSTPLKKNKKGEHVAKERLVLTMIDYMSVPYETFETSHLLEKIRKMLLVLYQYEPEKNPIDYAIEYAGPWSIPGEDLPQIKKDWETVVEKVRSGHAEDISGSDTLYLEACTKAANGSVRRAQPFSDVPAKPRAWALKASYMTGIEQRELKQSKRIKREKGEEKLSLLELIRKRFEPYFGKSHESLMSQFNVSPSKNACARITNLILGVGEKDKVEELEKAGAKPKTIRLHKDGRPDQAISFPAFDYFELEKTPFDESDFKAQLEQLYLFVIYREQDDGTYALEDVTFWQMPEKDIEEGRRCYEAMRRNVREGRADLSVKSSENRCCHVRPHGRNAADTRPQPHGDPVTKKCFWLNQGYLKDQIDQALNQENC